MFHYVYKLSKDGEGKILGKFQSLSAAKLSARLLLIEEDSFIVSDDLSRIYFFNEDGTWDYDVLTPLGKKEFFEVYPHPHKYK